MATPFREESVYLALSIPTRGRDGNADARRTYQIVLWLHYLGWTFPRGRRVSQENDGLRSAAPVRARAGMRFASAHGYLRL
jgi:hypothetical protein